MRILYCLVSCDFNKKVLTKNNYIFKHKNMKTSTNMKKAKLYKAVLLLLFVLNASVISAQCNAILKVDQDRNVRSTPAAGTYYKMEITNKGRSADTFSLSSENVNATTQNKDGSSNTKNVALTIEFLDKSLGRISEITVKPGETINFFAHIVVPSGTAQDRWSSNQVIAKSRNCSNYKVDTLLRTLVISKED